MYSIVIWLCGVNKHKWSIKLVQATQGYTIKEPPVLMEIWFDSQGDRQGNGLAYSQYKLCNSQTSFLTL